jgi:hypothetical protein
MPLYRKCKTSFQGRSWMSQLNQSHLNLRALPKIFKSLMSRPPHFRDLVQSFQLTKQWPPLTLSGSSPHQRKLHLKWSISRAAHLGSLCTMGKWTVMADKTMLTKISGFRIGQEISFSSRKLATYLLNQMTYHVFSTII